MWHTDAKECRAHTLGKKLPQSLAASVRSHEQAHLGELGWRIDFQGSWRAYPLHQLQLSDTAQSGTSLGSERMGLTKLPPYFLRSPYNYMQTVHVFEILLCILLYNTYERSKREINSADPAATHNRSQCLKIEFYSSSRLDLWLHVVLLLDVLSVFFPPSTPMFGIENFDCSRTVIGYSRTHFRVYRLFGFFSHCTASSNSRQQRQPCQAGSHTCIHTCLAMTFLSR